MSAEPLGGQEHRIGHFDGLVDPSFKRQPDGSTAFYPMGVLGGGYVLPDITFELALRRRLKVSFVALLPTVVGTVVIAGRSGLPILLGSCALLILVYYFWFHHAIYRVVRTFPKATVGLQLADTQRAQASALGWFWITVLFLTSAAFVILGAILLVLRLMEWPRVSVVILFFGFCSASFAKVALHKWRQRQGPSA